MCLFLEHVFNFHHAWIQNCIQLSCLNMSHVHVKHVMYVNFQVWKKKKKEKETEWFNTKIPQNQKDKSWNCYQWMIALAYLYFFQHWLFIYSCRDGYILSNHFCKAIIYLCRFVFTIGGMIGVPCAHGIGTFSKIRVSKSHFRALKKRLSRELNVVKFHGEELTKELFLNID